MISIESPVTAYTMEDIIHPLETYIENTSHGLISIHGAVVRLWGAVKKGCRDGSASEVSNSS